MSSAYKYLFPVMWLTYCAYWWVMARNVKPTKRREPGPSRLIRLVVIVGVVALLLPRHTSVLLLDARFLPRPVLCFWIGAGVTAAGLLFAIWARRHLGSNWSQAVTVKKGHELVTGGPYAIVRHPIYTGLLLAFLGCAIARGEWRGLLALALVSAEFWRKLRLEEKWMREQFGESYEAYARRVPALVPYVI
ncbi:MAG TPA: isoprenylcysteine carboxylmethyltransferase family protein [Verrucomicrobiae bacterium]|nr:isoprenylcysteine carboxylmethyltransferase family protein [Verrucomicrobiae bacterium]